MGNINWARFLAAALVAGLVMWLLEGAASMLYMEDMQAAMRAHNLQMDMSVSMMLTSILVSLLSSTGLMFFYVAARPRFGPGPRTAVIVAFIFWICGYVVALLGYNMMGLFSLRLVSLWAAIGLIEMVIATMLGAYIYREA